MNIFKIIRRGLQILDVTKPWYPPLCIVCKFPNRKGPEKDTVICTGPEPHFFRKPTGQPVTNTQNEGDHRGEL